MQNKSGRPFGAFLPPLESKRLKTFSYSSVWLESASGNGDKRLTK